MATLTIRNLDDELKNLLRIRAAVNSRSMEEEVRVIIKDALHTPDEEQNGLGSLIHKRFADVGGVELELPSRSEPPRKAVL